MSISVSPETFTFVEYDHDVILGIAKECAADAGLPADAEISITIVESSPLGRIKTEIDAGAPPTAAYEIEGGAFENLKAPRQFEAVRTQETFGRLFHRFADALDPAFGFAGDQEALSVPRQVAWDVYAVGRLAKKGYVVSHDRWLYLFRNRHAFTDESDQVFERIWSGDPLTWDELRSLSESMRPDSEVSTSRRVVTK